MKTNILKTITYLAILWSPALTPSLIAQEKPIPANDAKEDKQALVQLAVLLDTSGSMKGLIDQARRQIWSIVNEFISAKQNGRTPVVQVALYEYGNDGLAKEGHWIRRIQPLTRDLDKISEELFALKTNGGSEFCGAVIDRAASELAWSDDPAVYKAILIAGNEPFTQGPVGPKQACAKAISKGVLVNTIHCGGEANGISGGWKDGAALADGKFLVIDHNETVVHIDAPQDAEIAELNTRLNGTYIAYGAHGETAWRNQAVQDANNSRAGSLSARIATKASANYHNANWDLVDASKQKGFKIEELKEEDLPRELKKMSTEERKTYIGKKDKERKAIQAKILQLSKERSSYVSAKRAEQAKESGKETLGSAVVKAIRTQASAKNIAWEK